MKRKNFFNNFKERLSFLENWLRSPRVMGSIVPSSPNIGWLMGQHIEVQEGYIVEIGAGTGTLTQGLLNAGIPKENLIIIEINKKLVRHLQRKFPDLTIIQGDAQDLQKILPDTIKKKVHTVVSGLPFVSLPKKISKNILDSILLLLPEHGIFLQFTYKIWQSPLKERTEDLNAKRVGRVILNIPPAAIWLYQKISK